jgi:diguanylate cyclase (GGDEF)-like protein
MDLRSPVAEPNPAVERAVLFSRLIALSAWAVGWALLGAAWVTGSGGWLALFAGWYLALAGIVLVATRIPRARQSEADRAWTARFHSLAIHDDLTGLYNRRFFTQELGHRLTESRELGRPLTLALIDLDDFKSINDSFGHAAGDVALWLAGQSILAAAGPDAVVARLGGDEFAVILPDHTLRQGMVMADALRVALETSSFQFNATHGGNGWIRAAVGLAALDESGGAEELLHRADTALYARKWEFGAARDGRKSA